MTAPDANHGSIDSSSPKGDRADRPLTEAEEDAIWRERQAVDEVVRERFVPRIAKLIEGFATEHFSPEELIEVTTFGLKDGFAKHIRQQRPGLPSAEAVAERIREAVRIRVLERKTNEAQADEALAWIEETLTDSVFHPLTIPGPDADLLAQALLRFASGMDRIVECYGGIPARVVKRFVGLNHHTVEDLIGSGFIGLIRAATRYDPHRDAKFKAFAWRVIFHEMVSERRRMSGNTEYGAIQNGKFHRRREEMAQAEGRTPHRDEVIEDFNCGNRKIANAKARLRLGEVVSLSAPDDQSEDTDVVDEGASPLDRLERAEIKSVIETALNDLPEIQREIVVQRFLGADRTWVGIGRSMNLPEYKVRAFAQTALAELAKCLVRLGWGPSNKNTTK